MIDLDKNARHAERMVRKKAVVDAKIALADKDKGLLLVLTGNGKGKNTSALGMVARALGHGMNVCVLHFIKGRRDTGEENFFIQQPNVEWHVLGEGCTWDTQNFERDAAMARKGWELAKTKLQDPCVDLIVLGELNYALKYGFLDTAIVLEDLVNRRPMQHIIITGRGAPSALIEAADTVTEMLDTKHAFRAGIRGQRGIEL
ncbi:MAG: cob(I)yrinic acid a,c-diamide adenosyltransferase [Methylotenera sp.]|nr:cob(I)yrinic acid a,c-diamide adenosyltransferase [Methylotenera sp.]